ncbi:MAG: MFS transporter [Eubacteriales bacterium]
MEIKTKLWNKNFTIMTVGSLISMLGNSISGFAIGLLVLDYTKSIFLYSLTLVLYNLPKVVVGPYLDKFSRRKAMYTLDFISAALYAVIAYFNISNNINYTVILLMCFVIGTIDSIYMVAYESLFPLLITKDNYRKAYSVSAVIGNISQLGLFVAPVVYTTVGTSPLFAFNAFTFLIAAIFETMIKVDESHVQKLKEKYSIKSYFKDLIIGMRYLVHNKGLFYIVLFYTVLTSAGGMSYSLALPFFKASPGLGVDKYVYIIIPMVAGRLLGSAYHYTKKIADYRKYAVAVFAFFTMTVVDGSYLFLPLPVMMLFTFISGLMTVTTYNLRMSSTQNYVPNEMRARFNGTFLALTVLSGSIFGLIGGALAEIVPIPFLTLGGGIITIISLFAIIIRGKTEVKKVYNHEY